MAVPSVWLRLPPAVRLHLFAHAAAAERLSLLRATALQARTKHAIQCSASKPYRRAYATVAHQDAKDMREAYHFNVKPGPTAEPAQTKGQHQGKPAEIFEGQGSLVLPPPGDYIGAPADLFIPERMSSGVHALCSQAKQKCKATETFSAGYTSKKIIWYSCDLSLTVSNGYSDKVTASGSSKKAAKRAAWEQILARMHANGILRQLMQPRAAKARSDPVASFVEKQRLPPNFPTKDQYPHANSALFDPRSIQSEIHNHCISVGLALQSDYDYKASGQSWSCTLKVEVPDLCSETTSANDTSKAGARHAAWVAMLTRMHEKGILRELWPNAPGQERLVDEQGAESEATVLSKEVMAAEKDAKVEIYNYAAGFGLVPEFDIKQVQIRPSRSRLGRLARKSRSAKPGVRVTIKLAEQGIEATCIGDNLQTAEITASLRLKQQAEARQQSLPSDASVQSSRVLNTESARLYFDFYKQENPRTWIEIEHEQSSLLGVTRQTAQVTINGRQIGQTVAMNSKKQAEAVALLVAAVVLCRENPSMLQEFERRLRRDKGKVLRQLSAIDLPVDTESAYIMRTALVEARKAGLPDARETLSAEEDDSVTAINYPRKRRQLDRKQVDFLSKHLVKKQQAFEKNSSLQNLHAAKAALPMNQYRQDVIGMVSNHPHSIIVGATGSGKTTQVPQILLEHEIASGQGGSCNIVCTQPRRIAATSVAQRVAVERNEDLGQSVGYHVRFDQRLPESGGSIIYCTTGILLEQLKHDPDGTLDAISHLVVDEVHERDINIDFLMIIIKKALAARLAAGKSTPKVVLMSATLDTELFANYFSTEGKPCPSLTVPGRTYPVQEQYLEDVMLDLHKHVPGLDALLATDKASEEYLKSERAFSAVDVDTQPPTDSVIDWKRAGQHPVGAEEAGNAAAEKEEALVPTALLAAVIARICKTTKDGAILAFLPGIDEILKTQASLLESIFADLDFGDPLKFRICLLHSMVPKDEQAAIFGQPPPGCRKIILSTNIAETSITVTDVKHVVDTGKLRELRYDQLRRITKLQCVWESKSNAKQRAGRAGRVQDGYYWALHSKERHNSLKAVGLPELLRVDLQETVLSIKAQRFKEPVEELLEQAIEPPPTQAIRAARDNLQAIEALTGDERLTMLGRLLSKLPVHPTLGKMIVLGVIFRCLDPMLIFGAAANERSLFINPIAAEPRAAANRVRRAYAGEHSSDHLAILRAFREIRAIQRQDGQPSAYRRAVERNIHIGAFKTIDQTARQILEVLGETGLIPRILGSHQRETVYGSAELNRNSDNPILIQALLLAGLYPNLGAKVSERGSSYRTPNEHGVLMHPASLNDDIGRKEKKHRSGTLFAFSSLSQSNDGKCIFMRDSTMVSPLTAVLFGGRLQMSDSIRLSMDDWLPFFVQASDRQFATKLLLEFRKALDRVLNNAFRDLSNLDLSGHGTSFVDDNIRAAFTDKVVQLLDQTSGRAHAQAFNLLQPL
ncbi:hypothetical protein BAUCODRAFT_261696 [Baudoinia panamericana UAMH 10762]|uniref:RNA helicase n=1 Tax=Baudoinia panamericana (strain UAMH 10762) TaxID=717646 RepID=M2LFE9_BAUPA|nr:uncharacterized protein BAUCODRAFT_261696 [Baudoinia panamericana UAMH 10762]EMC92762.1 hypothetical protein BAUCODRAFT_261696 [Baudoinia panamericana UAMH 10762]